MKLVTRRNGKQRREAFLADCFNNKNFSPNLCRGVPSWAPSVAQLGAPTEGRPHNYFAAIFKPSPSTTVT